MRGIGPDELMLANLITRLRPENNDGVEVREVIVATNPTSPPPEPRTSFAWDVTTPSIVLTSAGAAVEPMTTTRFAGGASRIAWRSPPSATTSP